MTAIPDEALRYARQQCRIHGLTPAGRDDYAHVWALATASARTEAAHTRTASVHEERVRIITAVLDAIELYAEQAGSLLTDDQTRDMLALITVRLTDLVRKTGCICPRINVTTFDGKPSYLAGRHARCGMHDEETP